jgi:hypothetical protein
VLLSRAVESFDLYVLHILRLIYSVRPDLVVEEEKIVAEFPKTDFKTPDEYFLHLAEHKLHQLGYKSLADRAPYGFVYLRPCREYSALLMSR